MTDYIRKAVELADGWRIVESSNPLTVGVVITHELGSEGYPLNRLPQHIKDALAAQLVRQVDALGIRVAFDYSVSGYGEYVGSPFSITVGGSEGFISGIGGVTIKGPDRTMNTIRAIIDSGVLE